MAQLTVEFAFTVTIFHLVPNFWIERKKEQCALMLSVHAHKQTLLTALSNMLKSKHGFSAILSID